MLFCILYLSILTDSGKHYLLLSPISEAPKLYRSLAKEIFLKPQLTFSNANIDPSVWIEFYNTEWSGLRESLPANVHLLSMEQFLHNGPVPSHNGSVPYLIRFEHFYEVGEDPVLSQPVSFDIQHMFFPFDIIDVHELSLGANIPFEDVHRLKWKSADDHSGNFNQKSHLQNTTIVLNPMEIITLQVNLHI